MSKEMANLLFPKIDTTVEDYLAVYPPRNQAALRIAPSPTGFLHIGSLGMSLANRMLADKMGGIFFLRIEDTDTKREIDGAAEKMIETFNRFGVRFDESDHIGGKYGPYTQSQRTHIYHAFAKRLVERGRAYACFCTADEIDQLRLKQTERKENPGYHGTYAKCANLPLDTVKKRIDEGREWALRFLPDYEGSELRSNPSARIVWHDPSRGEQSLPPQQNNAIIIKSNGIPPYNFAHIVDDLLMRTSHVIRGEEWWPSTAEHIQIFRALFDCDPPWQYCQPPVICTNDNGSKRKLSKRKDKHALAENLLLDGYPREAIIDYLLSLYNTDYEMWRIENPTLPYTDFSFRFEKIGKNSPFFDHDKLNHISREVIARKKSEEINQEVKTFYEGRVDKESKIVQENLEKVYKILAIDRGTDKPRKDLVKYGDIWDEYNYLFIRPKNLKPTLDETAILNAYKTIYNASDTREVWFAKVKQLCTQIGYAPGLKEFKQNPEAYNFKGHIGDVTQAIRRAITGRENTPDLYQIMQILGQDEVLGRIM